MTEQLGILGFGVLAVHVSLSYELASSWSDFECLSNIILLLGPYLSLKPAPQWFRWKRCVSPVQTNSAFHHCLLSALWLVVFFFITMLLLPGRGSRRLSIRLCARSEDTRRPTAATRRARKTRRDVAQSYSKPHTHTHSQPLAYLSALVSCSARHTAKRLCHTGDVHPARLQNRKMARLKFAFFCLFFFF